MDINLYSILSATIVTDIFMLLFIFITSKNIVISQMPLWVNVICIFAIISRILFPIEFILYSNQIDFFKIATKTFDILYRNSVKNILICIWCVGTVIFSITYIKKYFLLYKKIKYIPQTKNIEVLGILNKIKSENHFNFKVTIILNKEINSPSEFGFFKQFIFLPDYKYKDEEIYYILLHEMIHFVNKSNWIKLFIRIVALIFWWNPVIKLFEKHIEFLLEVYTDKYVIINKDKQAKINYLNCILKIYCLNSSKYTSNITNSLIAFSEEKILKKRFEIIKTPKTINILLCISVFIILFECIFISYKYIIQPDYTYFSYDFVLPKFDSTNSYFVKENSSYCLRYKGKIVLKNLQRSDKNNVEINLIQ